MRADPGAFAAQPAYVGRWSRGWYFPVTTSAGEPHSLTPLQESVRRAVRWQIGHGRHRMTLAELAELTGARHRASVWHALHRLRALNLVAYGAPTRGRAGSFRLWIPRAAAARLAARIRARYWPSRAGRRPDRAADVDFRGNVVTPTRYAGFLSREGVGLAWRGMTGSGGGPPVAAAPRRGASPAPARYRRRPFPPRYVDETCPGTGHRARLELARTITDPAGDVAAVWTGRCRRDRRAIASGLVLVMDPRAELAPIARIARGLGFASSPAPVPPAAPAADTYAAAITARRRRLAVAVLEDGIPSPADDELRVRWLGYRRRPLEHPAARPALVADPPVEPAELGAIAWSEVAADLELVRHSRRLELPDRARSTGQPITSSANSESDELVGHDPDERANLDGGPATG